MRPAIRVTLSLALVMLTSCQSPAQQESPTQIEPNAQAAAPREQGSLEANFAGDHGIASEAGVTGKALQVENAEDRSAPEATDEGRIEAMTTHPPATTTPEQQPLGPHTTARVEVPPAVAADSVPPVSGDPRDDKIFELTERVAALQTEIEQLKQRLRQLEDLELQVANLKNSVANLSAPAGVDDAGRRALGAMAESPQLRGEIAEKLQGKVRLVNNTGREQVVYINGTAWTVLEGKSFVYAPVGKVSFQLLGAGEPIFKGIQEWQANPADDQMELVFDLSAQTGTSVLTRRPQTIDN